MPRGIAARELAEELLGAEPRELIALGGPQPDTGLLAPAPPRA